MIAVNMYYYIKVNLWRILKLHKCILSSCNIDCSTYQHLRNVTVDFLYHSVLFNTLLCIHIQKFVQKWIIIISLYMVSLIMFLLYCFTYWNYFNLKCIWQKKNLGYGKYLFKVEISGQLYNVWAKLYNLPIEIAFLIIPDDAFKAVDIFYSFIFMFMFTFVS